MTMSNRVHNECFLITDESLGDACSNTEKVTNTNQELKKKKSSEIDAKQQQWSSGFTFDHFCLCQIEDVGLIRKLGNIITVSTVPLCMYQFILAN